MIEKPLIIIIFMYFAGFCLVGVQYLYADVLGITLVNEDGIELRSTVLDILDMPNVNSVALNIANATDAENSTLSAIDNAFQVGYNVAKIYVGSGVDIAMLLTGTYIFNLVYWVGVPTIFIVPMVVIYMFMLGRTLIAYIRGV